MRFNSNFYKLYMNCKLIYNHNLLNFNIYKKKKLTNHKSDINFIKLSNHYAINKKDLLLKNEYLKFNKFLYLLWLKRSDIYFLIYNDR